MTNFFKRAKPRQFQLKPRYYDEHKERIENSKNRVKKKLTKKKEQEPHQNNIKGSFRKQTETARAKKNEKLRIGIILGAAIIIGYIVFNYAR